MWPIVKIFSILNCSIGSIIRAVSLYSAGHAGTQKPNSSGCRFGSAAGPIRNHAHRPHHGENAGREAEQKEHDEPPGGCRQQAVEAPANHCPDNNAGDQLRGKAKAARHCGSSGCSVSASICGLVSPDLSAVANFGQPLVETYEPCGKRSFIGRIIATSISTFVRAFSHAVQTRNDAGEWKCRPFALKS